MIDFEPFFNLLDEKGIPQRSLLQAQIIAPATLQRMRKNQGIRTDTINSICDYLRCQPMDIFRYTPGYMEDDPAPAPKKPNKIDQLKAELARISQELDKMQANG